MTIDDRRRWLWLTPVWSRHPWAMCVHDEQGVRCELAWPNVHELTTVVGDAVAEGPLPVFFHPVEHAPRFNRRVVEALRPFVRAGDVELIRLPHRDFAARAPFELPFDVVFFGDLDPEVSRPLHEAAWRTGEVAEHGFRVAHRTIEEYRRVPAARSRVDIAVCNAAGAHQLLGVTARRSWPPRHPRLIVSVDAPRALRGEPRRSLPPGVAMILAPCEQPAIAGVFVNELALQLVHDRPLHEAAHRAGAALPAGTPAPTLIADPHANWSISLSDAHRALSARVAPIERRFVETLVETRGPGAATRSMAGGALESAVRERGVVPRSEPSAERGLSSEVPPAHAYDDLPPADRGLTPELDASEVVAAFQAALPDFDRETRGLAALARVKASLTRYDRSANRRSALAAPRQTPRAVDIAVVRTRAAPPGIAVEPRDPMRVLPSTTLAAGQRYGLVVQIGARLIGGLVDKPSPIDPLLPRSPNGHRLDITALGLELAVESAPVVAIRLPEVGASDEARFAVRAPPGHSGPARVRVLITYLGRVLQSYVVTAQVGAAERDAPGAQGAPPAITARLEHRASPRFEGLDQLRARGASIVLNADPAGSHTLQVKRGSGVAICRFTEAQVDTITREIRGELTSSVGGESSKFPEPPPAAPALRALRTASFAGSIRTLAKKGAALHREVLIQVGPHGDRVVRELRGASDQTVQIVQASGLFSLPWAVLYDWTTPDDYAAFDGLPVCDGRSIVDGPGAALPTDRGCGHTAESTGVLCCRGFWGLRHRLELLLADPEGDNPVSRVSGHRAPLRVGLGQSVAAGRCFPAFTALCSDPAVAIAAGNDFAALLWSDRPAVLIALGKLTTEGDGMTMYHQIDLQPTLRDSTVANEISKRGRWADPHSLIMLLACSSAATSLRALLGMTRALIGAGAGAVIGTETDLFSGAASRFAAALHARLVAPAPGGTPDQPTLGAAMQTARWELIADHSPAALTFTAYGNADLGMGPAIGSAAGRTP